ncbi:DUF4349 domain-containing protein [Luteimonas sp. MC1572]|uniref:DUF4349 domain-containing protein n=1 Tax=Luteimonas sp. MC1572 TaxID=2799325 RepID=UPI0018F0FC8E|nr:DUF4349 domain-containing protein [Luteimonas sp. MC1572]MBJ6982694.1 DUF4349 domain-containing protein [Luteimonas sp. MC1572]QQO03936.1 DUF4349 domain-containing protein [Luteimonas sp. MC1572]
MTARCNLLDSRRVRWLALPLVAMLAACGAQDASRSEAMDYGAASAPAPMADAAAPAAGGQEFLAYEHSAGISLAPDAIQPRLREAQAACNDGRFGACVVLNLSQQGGDYPSASLGVRIVPEGVEPMIALASAGAELGHRSTHAEDLAVVVRDNALAAERLRNERARLQEFQARRDLAVADMIALSQRLAETEAALEAIEQQAAQHRRRIDTQLLTINFQATRTQQGRNEVALAVRDIGATLATGTAWTIRAAAFLLPLVAVLGILLVLLRRWRRRRKG